MLARHIPLFLVLTLFIASACQSEPEQPAPAQEETSAPDSGVSADTTTVPDSSVVDRTPETDPMFFEGIPNFEDLVVDRDGDWLVVLGSFERVGEPPQATIMRSEVPEIAALQQRAWNAGSIPFVLASEALPAFEPGFTVVILGPLPKSEAESVQAELQEVVPEAYIKSGW